mmetsp:Transcript_69932/g.227654  ORF Transcript_69932/g.227654 Transcript_69932/m.227654 type:complete len:241 (+) Transcript_69932:515-1237(+)
MQHLLPVPALQHLQPQLVRLDGEECRMESVGAKAGQGLVGLQVPTPRVGIARRLKQNVSIGNGLQLLDFPIRHPRHFNSRLVESLGQRHALCRRLLLELVHHPFEDLLVDSRGLLHSLDLREVALLRPMLPTAVLLPQPTQQGHRAAHDRVGRTRDEIEPDLAPFGDGLPQEGAVEIGPLGCLDLLNDASVNSLLAGRVRQDAEQLVHGLQIHEHHGLSVQVVDLLRHRESAVHGHNLGA